MTDRSTPRHTAPLVLAAAALAWQGAPPASGQASDAPAGASTEPVEVNPAGESIARSLQEERGSGVRLGPAERGGFSAILPSASQDDLAPGSSDLLREGAFLVQRQGIIRPLRNGMWAMVFDPVEGRELRPMVLQPSIRLVEMRRLVNASPEVVTFRVSGQVFAYRGRNYLLPTFFTVVGGDRESAEADAEARAGAAEVRAEEQTESDPRWAELLGRDLDEASSPDDAPAPSGQGEGDGARGDNDAGEPADDADNLLAELERQAAEASEGGRPGSGGGAGAGGADEGPTAGPEGEDALVREGVLLSARAGRLIRAKGGWAFVYDRDADAEAGRASEQTAEQAAAGRSLIDRPIRVMPGLLLESMERTMGRYEGEVRFSLSGQVYVYEGENWLLPTMYLVEIDRTGNLAPAQ
jgi:hypothetical protein